MNYTIAEVDSHATDWQDRAACRSADYPEIFFPSSYQDMRLQAWKVYCDTCPVKRECSASADNAAVGIYGGKPVNIEITKRPGRQSTPGGSPSRGRKRKPTEPVSPIRLREAIGTVLRQKREQRNLSLRQLGSKAFISHSIISEAEHGLKDLSSDTLNAAAKALGLTLSSIIFEAGMLIEVAEMRYT
jgi:ribosome-binding protein aMBF1 (putative translation factor)